MYTLVQCDVTTVRVRVRVCVLQCVKVHISKVIVSYFQRRRKFVAVFLLVCIKTQRLAFAFRFFFAFTKLNNFDLSIMEIEVYFPFVVADG